MRTKDTVKRTFEIPNHMDRRISQFTKETGIPRAWLVRTALDQAIERYSNLRKAPTAA